MSRRLNRAFDFRSRCAVRTHRVQSYDACHVVEQLTGFFDVHHFTAIVIAAFRTAAMLHLTRVTTGACGESAASASLMGAPAPGARLRVSAVGLRHELA